MSDSRPCPFCANPLPERDPAALGRGDRLAYDPWKGRLWAVCGSCRRWSAVPLALRWETLESCEAEARARGRTVLSSEHLALIEIGRAQLIRVGRPLRIEMAGWRYGDRMPAASRSGLLSRIFAGLPPPPVSGYRPYGLGRADPPTHWVLSPFQDAAWALTTAFTTVPLAPTCPACSGPAALRPWSFHELQVVSSRGAHHVAARCGLCDQDVLHPIRAARPALRLGLSVVDPRSVDAARAETAAGGVERAGGAHGFLEHLAQERLELGDMSPDERLALVISLDEDAEVEALEREWRAAEEIAAIMDGELTSVPGFDAFRRAVLSRAGG